MFEKKLWVGRICGTADACSITFAFAFALFAILFAIFAIPMYTENELSNIIIKEAIYIHKSLGPGLLESAYKECLFHRINSNGIQVHKEVPIPLVFEAVRLECGYRADLIVDKKVIKEIKCVDFLGDLHKAQVLTYLKLTGIKLGLLINFQTLLLKDGIKRIVNNL